VKDRHDGKLEASFVARRVAWRRYHVLRDSTAEPWRSAIGRRGTVNRERIDTMRPAEAPLANVVTLGALDFTRLRGFYQALGWPQVVDDEDFAAFELRGVVLALFAAERLAGDGRTDADLVHSGIRFTIAVMASRRTEVDELVDRMRVAGAVVTKEPTDAEFFEGRSAYLADPEGNYWEIAWAPDDNPIVAAAKRAASEPPTAPRRH
jgi:uncharacterized protein